MFNYNYNKETNDKIQELVNNGSTSIYLISTLSTYPGIYTDESIDMCYKNAEETYFYYKDKFLKRAEELAKKFGWIISTDRHLDTEMWEEFGTFLCVFSIYLKKNNLIETFQITFRTLPLCARND